MQTARDLIADSPEKAIAFAQSRSDPAFKLRLLLAVLRAWGETDPRSAMSWVLSQDESARASEMEATLKGAVTQTDIAVEMARELLGKNPDAGNVCASMLAGMLGAEGRFETAFGLVAEMSGDSKANSMAALFKRWGAEQPEDALKTLGMVSNEELRKSAYQAALNGWSENNYSSLAAYAMTLPSGAARDQALIAAVKNWSLQDPAGLGAWLNALPRGPEFDFGASMMIHKTDNANRSPELAAGWVESISDPDLRRISLEHLVNQWVRIDPVAARQYFLNSTWISATQRNQILARIQNASIVEDSSIDATQP
ncbi:MAG TPA: hypothetical protein VFM25_10535 [Verrucomicrobiae bacterium]|nr:hypothetical protein [Verrucomicrobiae bacterium]